MPKVDRVFAAGVSLSGTKIFALQNRTCFEGVREYPSSPSFTGRREVATSAYDRERPFPWFCVSSELYPSLLFGEELG